MCSGQSKKSQTRKSWSNQPSVYSTTQRTAPSKFENLPHVDERGQGDIPRFATAVSETPEVPNLHRDSVFIFSTHHRIKPSCTDTLMSYECAIQVYHSNHIEISTYRLPRKQTPQNELLDLYQLHRLFDHVCMSDSICTYHSSHRIRTVALRWLPVISKYHLVPTNSAKSRWCGITKLSIKYSSSKTKPGLLNPTCSLFLRASSPRQRNTLAI